MDPTLRTTLASLLDWQQAHVGFDAATHDLAPPLRGRRPVNLPYSAWELVEHVRIAQSDLLAFMTDDGYRAPEWPADYWPADAAPADEADWEASLQAVRRDRSALQEVAGAVDLLAPIPWGEGRTYLRTLLVAADHAAYHTGQIVLVRRALGAWPTP
jgi:uncharacterized damage-inducible protein DinB